ALAAPGSAVSITLPPLGPGWWVGEATLDPDELRADDRRLVVWRVAPPARVTALPGAGAFVDAALAVLREGQRGQTGSDVVIGERGMVREGPVMLIGSRLDTGWTALPASPAFVPFVDALVNRLARGEAPVVEAEGAPRVEFRTRGADTLGATVYGVDPAESDL